jgi:aryl-alcohol dehydrogenase-like predicted oxidoreductase
MKYRQLGNSGIQISEIGFGGWAIGGPMDLFGIPVGCGPVDDRQSLAAMERARELGVNFYDTADVYGRGHSEELIGNCPALKDCVIATKVGNARTPTGPIKLFSRDHIRKSIEQSLARLKRDAVDLYQLHNPPPDVWQGDEVFETLQQLKSEGKIRLIGVSISTMEQGIHLIENKKVDCLQVLFNILNQEPAKKLLPLAKENGIGIIVRVPLASGLLTGKFTADTTFAADDYRRNYLSPKRMREAVAKVERIKEIVKDTGATPTQIALAFILKHAAVSAPIPGAKTAEQVEQNVSASDLSLSDDIFKAIRKEFSGYNFYLRYGVRI